MVPRKDAVRTAQMVIEEHSKYWKCFGPPPAFPIDGKDFASPQIFENDIFKAKKLSFARPDCIYLYVSFCNIDINYFSLDIKAGKDVIPISGKNRLNIKRILHFLRIN